MCFIIRINNDHLRHTEDDVMLELVSQQRLSHLPSVWDVYSPWHRHWVEGTNGFCLIRQRQNGVNNNNNNNVLFQARAHVYTNR